MSEQEPTTGVQELIDRLSQEGVVEGQRQAEQIVQDAQQQADRTVESARRQADELLGQARKEADRYREAGEEALRMAARDAVRDFGARIHTGLRNRLQERVQHQMEDAELIKTMILEITRQATAGIGDEEPEWPTPGFVAPAQANLMFGFENARSCRIFSALSLSLL